MIHTIAVEIPDSEQPLDAGRIQRVITEGIERVSVGSTRHAITIENHFARVVEYRRSDRAQEVEDVTALATRHEAIGKVEFDGITYGVEVSKDDERRTNIKFTSDPPFSKTSARVVYEWTGRLEKDR